jgi:hypothetical protein
MSPLEGAGTMIIDPAPDTPKRTIVQIAQKTGQNFRVI